MPDKKPSPRALAREAVRRLKGQANPLKAEGAQRYFKDAVKAYGISAAEVRSLAAELYKSVKGVWTVTDATALCDILFAAPELESKAVGALVLCRFKEDFPPSFPGQVKTWLAADLLDNWASVDVFCVEAMGAFLAAHPARITEVKNWAFHPDRWVKRASAVSFIKLAKRDEFLDAIYEVAASLFPVDDDLIHKATGWLLREAGKRDRGRLEAFLFKHGPAVPRTTLRYAIERLPEARRKTLLRQTR
jgi:3-methyladenine DNA glycosylase AlkD